MVPAQEHQIRGKWQRRDSSGASRYVGMSVKNRTGYNGSLQDALIAARRRAQFMSFVRQPATVAAGLAAVALTAVAVSMSAKMEGEAGARPGAHDAPDAVAAHDTIDTAIAHAAKAAATAAPKRPKSV